MEDQAEEIGAMQALRSAANSVNELASRLKTVVREREDASAWFAQWGPVVAALGRLGPRVAATVFRLRHVIRDGDGEVLPTEEREAIADELKAIARDFPDTVEVFLGLGHVDAVIDAIVSDEAANATARRIASILGGLVERLVQRFIDVALGESEPSVGPEEVVAMMKRFESFAESVTDRWIPRGLGMVSSVVMEDENE